MAAYTAKDYSKLIGLSGFSDNLLANHFKLYSGYVSNVNKLANELSKLDKVSAEFAELKRRFGWEFNGMRLHELYFSNLTKKYVKPTGTQAKSVDLAVPRQIKNLAPELFNRIKKDFGSYENFEKDFKAMASMRGIGWIILYYDKQANQLFNCWVNEHDIGHLAGCDPLLVMDVFEHAWMLEYGSKADYINSFFKAIDWKAVEARL